MRGRVNIAPEAMEVLSRSRADGNIVRLPEGQLDRAVYTSVDKVLKALGGKWDRRAGGHVFAAGMGEQLTAALEAGSVVDCKKAIQLFETPAGLAKRMADIAAAVSDHVDRNIRVLEPSAGRGRLLAAFAEHLEADGQDEVWAIDIDATNCADLRAQGIATEVVEGDFLSMRSKRSGFDVILMNPPFSRNADVEHVEHAFFDWLAADGVLVAIMSTHWHHADDVPSRRFREVLRQTNGSAEMIPAGAFKAEGTNIATTMVTLRKARS